MDTKSLIKKHGVISDQITEPELIVILNECQSALKSAGNMVEFGCYAGTTSLFIQRLIESVNTPREFHVYDSFEGLPEKLAYDVSPLGDQFKAGELAAAKKTFIQNFKKAGLILPYVHKGWFSELEDQDVPSNICFAFLDGDYYESIKTPLTLIAPKFSKNAIIVVDDYGNPALPGAKKAVDEWANKRSVVVQEIYSLAVIRL